MVEPVTRSALGQVARCGDLYDARSDQFCFMNVFKDALPPTAIETTANQHTDAHYKLSSKQSEKLENLDVQGHVKLSILAKICKLEGSAKYLNEEKQSEKAVSAHLTFNVKTVNERLNIFHDNLKGIINTDVAQNKTATHVVVGINWGANAVLSIEHKNSDSKSQSEIRGKLEAMLGNLKLGILGEVKIHGEVQGEYKNVALAMSEECTYKIFADLLPGDEKLSPTLDGYYNIMEELPKLIQKSNDGKGKPLSYELMPLSALQKHIGVQVLTDNIIRDIEEKTVTEFVNLFEEITSVEQKVNDLYHEIESHHYCTGQKAIDGISGIKSKFESSVSGLRSKLAKEISRFRRGEVGADDLGKLIQNYWEDNYSHIKVRAKLNEFDLLKTKIEFIDALKSRQVKYLPKGTSDTFLLKFHGREIYILNYNMYASENNKEQWEENRKAFFSIIKTSNDENGPVCAVAEDSLDDEQMQNEKRIFISFYEKGSCISNDVVADSHLALAKSTMKPVTSQISNQRAILKMKCPGVRSKNCQNVKCTWQCSKCHDTFEYGFGTKSAYCTCGKVSVTSLKFKCNDPKHGFAYMEFDDPKALLQIVAKLTPMKYLNILLLGETGVGKSTWINGLVNYMTYPTLQEADQNEIKYLIPSSFTMTDENFEQKKITMGTFDYDETNVAGQSATQIPKSYVFTTDKSLVRLIDTPGIGDTRGIDKDKENFQKIMSHLSHFDEIHGICILLKPNAARLTVMFQFCIKELLTHLHKDCCKNIVFVFTNARSTFYRPGDTMTSLKTLLNENKYIKIELSKNTVYCMDNESIRFLAASKKGIDFDDDDKENYSKSWDKSVAESNRLIDYIRGLEAHKTQQTLSLNETRRMILALTKPLTEIGENIDDNVRLAENVIKRISVLMDTKQDLTGKLKIPGIDLKSKQFDYPRTVCVAGKCTEQIPVNGVIKINYKQVCHDHCYLKGIELNTFSIANLKHCTAMNGGDYCTQCGCIWSMHMHISYECLKVPIEVVDENVEKLLNETHSNIEKGQILKKQADDRIKQLNWEKTEVVKAASEFGIFLKNNAITPYNDAIDQYLRYCIKIEESQVAIGGDNARLDALKKMLEEYGEEVKILNNAMANKGTTTTLTLEEIQKKINHLFTLKETGAMIQDLMNCEVSANKKSAEHRDVHVRNKLRSGHSNPNKHGNYMNNCKTMSQARSHSNSNQQTKNDGQGNSQMTQKNWQWSWPWKRK